MKLAFGSIFKKKESRRRRPSVSKRHEDNLPSFGSGSTASSSYSTASDEFASPRTVLPLSVSDLFNIFDRNRDGKITKQELEYVLSQLGGPHPLTDDELTSMVEVVDRDGDGCISLEELAAIEGEVETSGDEEELRDAFMVFDADGDGKISAEELYEVMAALGEGECSMEECRRMIDGVDSDGDGFVCFTDFVRMMEGQAKR